MQFLGRIKKIDPRIVEDWGQKCTIPLKHPEVQGSLGRLVTNMTFGMRVEINTPPGTFTPVTVEKLGLNVEIRRMNGFDQVQFWLQNMDQCDPDQLETLFREAIAGRRTAAANG